MSAEAGFTPLIAILGATGTGKSKLAVELAKRFNGEIINGDAMQIYKGLPIITNKISEAERENIPHHIFDRIGIDEPPWLVTTFRREARKTIREIHSRGRLPILVGGTHYYAEAVLLSDYFPSVNNTAEEETGEQERHAYPILNASTSEILAKLREVDPRMADRWHPLDRRKILRSLEIYLQTGQTASHLYEEQNQQRHNGQTGQAETQQSSLLAYPSLVLWLRAEEMSLKARLDSRVDSMIEAGLISEVQSVLSSASTATVPGQEPDKTRGVWVSIGIKEMEPYVTALQSQPSKSNSGKSDSSSSTNLNTTKQTCIDSIKSSTRQYARRQERWLFNHLPSNLVAAGCNLDSTLRILDSTDPSPSSWLTNVINPATQIVNHFLSVAAGASSLATPSFSSLAQETMEEIKRSLQEREEDRAERGCRHCEICDKTMMTRREWERHVKGNAHRKAVRGRRKWEEYQLWKEKGLEREEKKKGAGTEAGVEAEAMKSG